MSLPQPAMAAFKYKHGDPGKISKARTIGAGALALLGVVSLFFVFQIAAFFLIVAAFLFFKREKKLLIGPRYLLCGNSLVYFANVTRLRYAETEGRLSVECASGKTFVLDRDKFPTGARKADKIKRNKAAKFTKVAGKIVDKVRTAATNAELVGVPSST